MRKIIVTTLLTYVISVSVYAADTVSNEKIKLIDTLLEQTGQTAVKMGDKFSNSFALQMNHMLQQHQPDINPKAFVIIEEESKALITEELVVKGGYNKMMYPIYHKNFTEGELQQMINLNNTELGRKMLKVLPVISEESLQAGQQFGVGIAPKIQERIMARFREEGIFKA
ncbi:DUF2059 domain-containing protein [Oceanisphaera sp. W20_SRM_FM3]|uniref:DUF2059 domain-containing protein n=1 Tax=Oceanisphaera sp. W20_SRM_FM3 TaxID=3240267 RepID=UPI003F9796AE